MKRGAPKSTKSRLRHWGHAAVRVIRSVVWLEDTPYRIAAGCGVGLFFCFQPFVGSQMLASAIVCKIARVNVVASLPWSWLSNPFTVGPIYYLAYRLGAIFFPSEALVSYERIRHLANKAEGETWFARFKQGWAILVDIAIPLQIGCVIIGVVLGLVGFILIRKAVNALQARRLSRRNHWSSRIHPVNRSP
jgi:uncharacterized protein